MIETITVADLPACASPEPTTFIHTDSAQPSEPIERGRDKNDRPGHIPAERHGATVVPPFERRLLRALIDLPAFAEQVMPVLDAEFFADFAIAPVFEWIAEDYRQHHT